MQKEKDPILRAASLLGVAVREKRPEAEIQERRRELAEARLEKAVLLALAAEFPISKKAANRLCRMLREGAITPGDCLLHGMKMRDATCSCGKKFG